MSKPFDPTKPVQTRDGRPARIVAQGLKSHYSIIAVITEPDGGERAITHTAEGVYRSGSSEPGLNDLINVPEKRRIKGFFNLYYEQYVSVPIGPVFHPTRELADSRAGSNPRFACIPVDIEVEEGQGL